MALENCILRVNGQRWKVRTARSCKLALAEIAFARVTGSIGGSSETTFCEDGTILMADVVQVNSDNTERQPYSLAY